MKAIISFTENYAIGIPLVFGLSTLVYAILIWLALGQKDFVKAKIWHRKSGFSIEAGNNRRKSED